MRYGNLTNQLPKVPPDPNTHPFVTVNIGASYICSTFYWSLLDTVGTSRSFQHLVIRVPSSDDKGALDVLLKEQSLTHF